MSPNTQHKKFKLFVGLFYQSINYHISKKKGGGGVVNGMPPATKDKIILILETFTFKMLVTMLKVHRTKCTAYNWPKIPTLLRKAHY